LISQATSVVRETSVEFLIDVSMPHVCTYSSGHTAAILGLRSQVAPRHGVETQCDACIPACRRCTPRCGVECEEANLCLSCNSFLSSTCTPGKMPSYCWLGHIRTQLSLVCLGAAREKEQAGRYQRRGACRCGWHSEAAEDLGSSSQGCFCSEDLAPAPTAWKV
jgi:hypothetical protein